MSNIVNTNISHYFKRKIAIYIINITRNPNIFRIKRDENILWRHLCIHTLITDGLQPIRLLLFKQLLCKLVCHSCCQNLKLIRMWKFIVLIQRNFTSMFHGLGVKITYNRLVTSFIKGRCFASFFRKLALNNMQISYLWNLRHSTKRVFTTVWFSVTVSMINVCKLQMNL